ncbi:hypothetical protein BS47DRAFT_1150542 [Hydnum rufescens UP504]|uniref:Uncharacterized protein n=1 Tax=Hydnum rufescens UP504 TaxID=1448309 RepID=A0A9P6B8B4_9AGAM|nr:hypothetical protein BS47DRAFT_1150542 [Hydnum rufescens UP504]
MSGFVIAFLVANVLNIVLNSVYLLQLGIYFNALADTDPAFLRVIVYSFSVFDVFHTGIHLCFLHHILRIKRPYSPSSLVIMACLGWNLHAEFLHPQTFLRLYATIRSWNAPISAVVYGFYAFQILHLTGSWKIPLVIVSLVLTQIAGSIIWTVGTMTVKSPFVPSSCLLFY